MATSHKIFQKLFISAEKAIAKIAVVLKEYNLGESSGKKYNAGFLRVLIQIT
jgi:hypothetical protein